MLQAPMCCEKFFTRYCEVQRRELMLDTTTESEFQVQYSELLRAIDDETTYLEPLHIFALAHVLHRPIIVYGSERISDYHNLHNLQTQNNDSQENTVRGIYLPLFVDHTCDNPMCPKNYIPKPIMLAFTSGSHGRGHFTALVCSCS